MNARDLTDQAGWLVAAGLLVSFHRLAVGFALSDGPADAGTWTAVALTVLGGLSAIVLTGAQMILASTLAVVHDRLLHVAWLSLVVCAVIVMSASTLASMHGADLATILDPAWLGAHVPAVVLAVGLSLAIEIALASVRRASILLRRAAESIDDLDLDDAEQAELAVQAELRRYRSPVETQPAGTESAEIDTNDEVRQCPWCSWTASYPQRIQAINAVKAHQRHCPARPVAIAAGG
ncbi:MAG: hypothetical protein AAGE94_20810 [Acidobacteriota bacterium]